MRTIKTFLEPANEQYQHKPDLQQTNLHFSAGTPGGEGVTGFRRSLVVVGRTRAGCRAGPAFAVPALIQINFLLVHPPLVMKMRQALAPPRTTT